MTTIHLGMTQAMLGSTTSGRQAGPAVTENYANPVEIANDRNPGALHFRDITRVCDAPLLPHNSFRPQIKMNIL
jgi:hypothetical protein